MDWLSDQLDASGLFFGRERELLETVASLARTMPDGALVWRGTNAQLAERLDCTTRTLGRVWQTLRAMRLPWLEVTGTRGAGLYVRCAPARNGQPTDKQETTNGQAKDNQRTSNGQATDNKRTSNGQVTDTRARVPYEQILPTEESAGLPAASASEETPEASTPASQPLTGLAEWLKVELTGRATRLVQHPAHQPDPAALVTAAASLMASLGSEASARRYTEARLLAYELRPPTNRPGTMARLIMWLLQDSARADLRAAAEGAAEAPPARAASQSYASEGFDQDLAAAVAHGTRNAEADAEASAAWEAKLYRDRCEQAFKEAKYFGEIPKDLTYSDDAMTRYGLWPEREEATR